MKWQYLFHGHKTLHLYIGFSSLINKELNLLQYILSTCITCFSKKTVKSIIEEQVKLKRAQETIDKSRYTHNTCLCVENSNVVANLT